MKTRTKTKPRRHVRLRACAFCGAQTGRGWRCARCVGAPQDEASQLARIDGILERELLGDPLPDVRLQRIRGDVQYPVEPLRRALAPILDLGLKVASARLGVSERRLRAYLAAETIDRARAERLVVRAGLRESQVYPRGARTRVEDAPEIVVRLGGDCADPGCTAPRSTGRFCAEHAARLAAIRKALDARSREFDRSRDDDDFEEVAA